MIIQRYFNIFDSTSSQTQRYLLTFGLRLQYTFKGVSRASDVARAV